MAVDWDEFLENCKKGPFADAFHKKRVAHTMVIWREEEDKISIGWRPIDLDTRDKRKGAKFINRGRGAWKIFKNPYPEFVKNNKLKFYYHTQNCFCCSYPNWTPKQEGNPYANRNMYDGPKLNIVRREYN